MKLFYIQLKIFFGSCFTMNSLYYHNVWGVLPGSPAVSPKDEISSQKCTVSNRKHNKDYQYNVSL